MAVMNNQYFDRIITVDLLSSLSVALPTENNGGTIAFEDKEAIYTIDSQIVCPAIGRKPNIMITGQFNSRTELNKIQVKLMNFYTSKELSDFKYIKITSGYSNGLKSTIVGQIFQSYPQSPPPDSVTIFDMIVGNLETYVNTTITHNFSIGDTLETILFFIADQMKLDLFYNYSTEPIIMAIPISFNEPAVSAIQKVKEMFNDMIIRFDASTLLVTNKYNSSGKIYELTGNIKQAYKDAYGFVIKALYDPRILPQDIVYADPQFYSQNMIGTQAAMNITGGNFVVLTNDISFETVGSINEMSLRVVKL